MSDSKPKRKRCLSKNCRRLSIGSGISDLCPVCEQKREEREDPFFGQKRLTEAEAERWARLDAEIRNAGTGIEIRKIGKELSNYKENERKINDRKIEDERRDKEKKRQEAWEKHQQQLIEKTILQQKKIDVEINGLTMLIQKLGKQYEEFVVELAKKYQVDRKKMVIDPDTRVIREPDF